MVRATTRSRGAGRTRSASARHPWKFLRHLRARGFGWRSSKLAAARVREAISEIRQVARHDPLAAAEGAVLFIERIEPALAQVDSSSGSLGTAVSAALDALVQMLAEADLPPAARAACLDRIWSAFLDAGMGYLDWIEDRWGELCASQRIASERADQLRPHVDEVWASGHGYAKGVGAFFSCLLSAGRLDEILPLLERAPRSSWALRHFGVEALRIQRRYDEALRYAEGSRSRYDPDALIDRACERILLDAGLAEEAYRRYALRAHARTIGLETFRSLARTYPQIPAARILADLIVASPPGEEGRWFATARRLGQLEVALDLARKVPCDPRTLNRAARDHLASHPEFAFGCALASLRWLCEGWGYEITNVDVAEAARLFLSAAAALGRAEEGRAEAARIVEGDRSPDRFVRRWAGPSLDLPVEPLRPRPAKRR